MPVRLIRSVIECVFEVIHELWSGFLGIVVELRVMVGLKEGDDSHPGVRSPDYQAIILLILFIHVNYPYK